MTSDIRLIAVTALLLFLSATATSRGETPEVRACLVVAAGPQGSIESFPEAPPIAADLDGDGRDDLALADSLGLLASQITVLLSQGDGTFAAQTPFETGGRQWGLTSADLDADGDVDLVTSHSDVVRVHRNRGDATFEDAIEQVAVPGRNTQVSAAEVTGDEHLDLVVGNFSSSGFAVLPGLGEGRFGAPVQFDAGGRIVSMLTADFNGDTHIDVVVVRSGDVAVFLGDGAGSFGAPVGHAAGPGADAVAAADLDSDGNLDLIVGVETELVFLRGDGKGGFTAGETYPASGPADTIVARDLNGDGHVDVAWSAGCRLCSPVLLNDGTGLLREPLLTSVALGDFVTSGDFDGDRHTDLVAVFRTQILQVIASRPLDLRATSPSARQVFQRDDSDRATFPVEGYSLLGAATRVEARAVPRKGFGGMVTAWSAQDAPAVCESFSIPLTMSTGWYDVELRAFSGEDVIARGTIERVGVGEVFITAGQSNSLGGALELGDERVSSVRFSGGWVAASNPLGSAGPWGPAGVLLARRLDMPVGFMNLGVGGTEVRAWLPGGSLYERFVAAFEALQPNGFRAILWHQGESDAGRLAEVYAERLNAIIAQTRIDAGFAVPWGVALASLCGSGPSPSVIEGQQNVIDGDPLVFQGAATDELAGLEWRPDFCHFGERGLREHGRRWSVQIARYFNYPSQPLRRGDVDLDGALGIPDAIATLGYLFLGTERLPCEIAADADDDGRLSLTDAIRILVFAFRGVSGVLVDEGACARDTTVDGLTCEAADACR